MYGFFVLNNVLSTIVRLFVSVRWHTSATVLLSQQCQRCYRHSCNRRCVDHHSRSPRQRSNPACFGQKSTTPKNVGHTLPCLPLVTPFRKARFARGPGPSTVRPSSWAIFSSFARLMIGSADLWTPGSRVDVDVTGVERQSSCLHCIVHHSVQHTDPT